jgi:hypothetical protein
MISKRSHSVAFANLLKDLSRREPKLSPSLRFPLALTLLRETSALTAHPIRDRYSVFLNSINHATRSRPDFPGGETIMRVPASPLDVFKSGLCVPVCRPRQPAHCRGPDVATFRGLLPLAALFRRLFRLKGDSPRTHSTKKDYENKIKS